MPLMDVDGGGAVIETPAPVEAVDPGGDDDGESLDAHEAAFSAGAKREKPAAPSTEPAAKPESAERDETGKFKAKHRAKSQQASAEDVPRIAELTRKLREAERALDETRRTAAPVQPPEREQPRAAQPPAKTFPTWDEYIVGKENPSWEEYSDERTDWRYDQRRAAERAEEAQQAETRSHREVVTKYLDQLEDARKAYADFDDIVGEHAEPIPVSDVVGRAALEVGPRASYYLATHPEEREALSRDTAIAADTPGFKAAVAGVARYLKSLVAAEQRPSPSSRAAAAATGSAPMRGPTLLPKPPNPVRTGTVRSAEALPGDDAPLEEHERAFYRPSRRA